MNTPSENSRSDLFDALADLGEDLVAAARLLQEALYTPSPSRLNEDLKHVRALEEASNATVRDVIRGLEGYSGLPAFRVTVLLRYLDDAMDAMEEAAGFLQAYAVEQRTGQAVKLASFLVRATEGLLRCITSLKEGGDIGARVRAVAEIEDEADDLYRAALGSLMIFGADPFHAMRWKDVYDRLEEAIDRCEEAAQLLGGVSPHPDPGPPAREEGGT